MIRYAIDRSTYCMMPSDMPTPVELLPSSSAALRIAKDINLRADSKRASQMLPKALRNWDEADPLPGASCVIRQLRAYEAHWCELCGEHPLSRLRACIAMTRFLSVTGARTGGGDVMGDAKVYMRAEDNEAGVTVEEWPFNDRCPVRVLAPTISGWVGFNDTEARAVVEGLLRRMLEKDGEPAVDNWFHTILAGA